MGGLKKVIKAITKVDPLRGGDKLIESAGLPTMTGEGDKNILDMGQAAAEKAAKEANDAQAEANRIAAESAAAQLAQQQQLATINKNYAADLGTENRAQIVAGGTAGVMDEDAARKKRQGTGLASTLGINA